MFNVTRMHRQHSYYNFIHQTRITRAEISKKEELRQEIAAKRGEG